MKKILALMLSLMLMLTVVGCGDNTGGTPASGSSDTGGATGGIEPEEEMVVPTSIAGQWECVSVEWVDHGKNMTTEDIEELFEVKAADLLKITATTDGKAEVTMGMGKEETMPMLWTEADDNYVLTLDLDAARETLGAEEASYLEEEADAYKMVATLKDDQLTVVSDSSYESEGEQVESIITYVLKFKGMTESSFIPGWNLLASDKQSRDMSNFMSYGHYLVVGDTLYADMGGETLHDGSFSYAKLTLKGDDGVEVGKAKIIMEKVNASYLNECNGYIYALINAKKIIRVKMGSTDTETIYDGESEYVQSRDNRLYFTDKDYHFCSTDLDGKDLQVVLDKEVYFPYIVDGTDWLIYQDDADSESLHIYNLSTKNDVRLTDEPSYHPILGGAYLFYMTMGAGDDDYRLNRLNLFNGEHERDDDAVYSSAGYAIEGGQIVPVSASMLGMDFAEWNTFADIRTTDNGYTRFPMYSNGTIYVTEDDGDHDARLFRYDTYVQSNGAKTVKIGRR